MRRCISSTTMSMIPNSVFDRRGLKVSILTESLLIVLRRFVVVVVHGLARDIRDDMLNVIAPFVLRRGFEHFLDTACECGAGRAFDLAQRLGDLAFEVGFAENFLGDV